MKQQRIGRREFGRRLGSFVLKGGLWVPVLSMARLDAAQMVSGLVQRKPLNSAGGGGGEGPVPVFKAEGPVAESDAGGGATLEPVNPAHVLNDVFVAVCYSSESATHTCSAGWTQIAQVTNLASMTISWWWKRATGTSETNPVFGGLPVNPGNLAFARVYSFEGCVVSGDPFENAQVSAVTTDTAPATLAVTTLGANRLMVCFLGVGDNTAMTVEPPASSGYTERSDYVTSIGSDGHFWALSKARAAAGEEPAASVGTISAAENWCTLTLALKPTA